MIRIFIRYFVLTIFHFLVKHFGDPLHTDFCRQQLFAEDHLNHITANAHQISYLMHSDSVILENDIFYSSPVFFTESFRWASQLGHIFKAYSALTKLSSPMLDRSIWWRFITVHNKHSVVSAMAEQSAMLTKKFCHCVIGYNDKSRLAVLCAKFNDLRVKVTNQTSLNVWRTVNKTPLQSPLHFSA